jgi:fatty acid desaturase
VLAEMDNPPLNLLTHGGFLHIAVLALPSPYSATGLRQDDYAELKRRVNAAGLLARRPGYYAVMIFANSLAFAGLLVLLGLVHEPWLILAVTMGLAFGSGQLGFQLHDAGHRQMFSSDRLNMAVGFITANLLLGMSYGWWVEKHNRHHGSPNHIDLDPDIRVGMITYTTEQAIAKRGLQRRIAGHQAYFFFPLLLGLAWSMHVAGIRFLVARRSRAALLEAAALLLHFLFYIGLLTALVGPWWALAVVIVHKCLGGFYLASVFAPNHKGMPQISRGERLDFLRSQVLTSRNVRAQPVTDFLYGGLNYQIEHHLFPTMPRCNMRSAQGIVRSFCAEVGLVYYETSILQSYREILAFLHEVGAPLRRQGAIGE